MKAKHALLSASSAYRWLACPPSALLSAKYEDTSSSYAQEGTAAHALAEYKVLKALGRKADDPTENLDYFNEEMDEATDAYAGYVLEQVAEAKKATIDPIVLVEQRVDFSTYVPDGFGTADALIIADGKLSITDLKYGQGVLVEADHNPQLMCYALGAYEMFSALYDIETVSMTIFQPRRDSVSVFEMKASDLLDWAENTLKPKAELAAEGKGDFTAGEHCRFCKAKADCRARAEANLALARYDFALPPTLTDADIEAILPLLDELTSWAEDIKAYALTRAVAGKEWHGYKLVAGRSNRKYVNEDAVAKKVSDAGFNPYEEKLLGITAMTKLLGKNRFEELLEGLIEKPQGKPTLVPESDKRPTMNSAKEDFKEEN